MPERSERLRQVLSELEQELSSLDTVDDETRAVLEEISHEIHDSLHPKKQQTLEPESVTERLKVAVQKFEADHPTLAGAVTRLIDALGQMGI